MQKNTPKLLFFMAIFLCLTQTSFISCSQDEDLIDLVGLEDPEKETVDGSDGEGDENSDESSDQEPPNEEETDNAPDFDSSDGLKIDNTPCDYTLDGIESNSTMEIACRMDLGGQAITVPSGVTFLYAGGEIVNGTLIFSAQGIIDGGLLNKDLTIEGDVKLNDPAFQFYPERWDIVEGRVAPERALINKNNFENLIFEVKHLGAEKFLVDKFDAYFKVDGFLNEGSPSDHAINLPSDFHLSMSDNTFLRMQPNNHFRPILMSIYKVQNVLVTGGNLFGDREEHDYSNSFVDSDGSTGPTHEWVHVLKINGGKNITIDGLTIKNAAGDGISISSVYHHFDSRHIESRNIWIKNSKIISSRRTNLVITDGEQIYIEGNELIDGGIDMANSYGVAPSSNLNIEPVRHRNAQTGELTEYERVTEIYIRRNKQIVNNPTANPSAGSFQISHGNGPIIIENNEMINTGVSFHTADGVSIRNNTITNGSIGAGSAESFDRENVVFNNEVIGNIINSEGVGISVSGNGVKVQNNKINASSGIALGPGATSSQQGVSNSQIVDNEIVASSRGIYTMNSMHNVLIEGNRVEMLSGATFAFVLVNRWEYNTDANFIVSYNNVVGHENGTVSGAPPNLLGANSINVLNNTWGEIQINGGRDMVIEQNTIDARIANSGIWFRNDSPFTQVRQNDITVYSSNIPCIKIDNDLILTSVDIATNNCLGN